MTPPVPDMLAPIAPTLALAGWATNLLTLAFLLICVVMILIVLIQRPQGGGLSGAFGSGAGSGQTAFGAKTGDALTYATIGIFVLFLLAAVGLNFAARPSQAPPAAAAAVATTESPTESPTGPEGESTDPSDDPAPAAETDAADADADPDEAAPEPSGAPAGGEADDSPESDAGG